MDIESLPFNRLAGIRRKDDGVSLTPRAELLNHVGTVHATVVFGVAEAASGQVLLARFPELAETTNALMRQSKLKYRRPALPDHDILGMGEMEDTAVNRFLDLLKTKGRATIDISVSVTQDNNEIACGTFTWFAARK